MKIAIDLTSLSFHVTGIERYAACMTEEMLTQDNLNQYILVFRNEVYKKLTRFVDENRIKVVILHGNNKLIFNQVILPVALYRLQADKFIFFAFTSPIIFRKSGIINTIHDMGAWDSPESMRIFQKIYWRVTMRLSARVSEKIITVSNFSKERISDILNYPKERISVIYGGAYDGVTRDYGFSFDDIMKIYNLPKKYIMTLSTLEPRKNIGMLLEAFSEIQDKVDYDLVLVGRNGWKMNEVIAKFNSNGRVHITGFVKDEHLSPIYKNALCFIFPSKYEGFGIPPLEALALGTPVISSNVSSLPEILMKQAMYFDNSKVDLKEKLLNLYDNLPCMKRTLNDFQKSNFSFSNSAKKLIKLIKE